MTKGGYEAVLGGLRRSAPSGVTFKDAMFLYAGKDLKTTRAARRVGWALTVLSTPDDFSPDVIAQIDLREVVNQLSEMHHKIIGDLCAERLVCSAFPPGPGTPDHVRFPGSWWASHEVDVDLENNTASAGGMTITGLLIFKPFDDRQEKLNNNLRDFAEGVFQKFRSKPKAVSLKQEFMKVFPCKTTEYDAARKALPEHLRRGRGERENPLAPPRKSNK